MDVDLITSIWLRNEISLTHAIALLAIVGGGTEDILRLTSNDVEDLRKSISFVSLSLTFQHAIITRALGQQCLWIDSLCILQDSLDD